MPFGGVGLRGRPLEAQARMAELVDALDLGSSGFPVGVRVPLLA